MTIIREMKLILFITIINILLISTYQATINSIDNNNAQSLQQGNNDEDDTVIIEASRSTDNSSKPKIVNRINEHVDTDDDGPICVCVPYYLCDANNTVITDGAGVIDIRSKPVSCSNALEVCCSAPLDESTIPTLPPRYIDGTTEVGCGRRNFDGAGVRIKGDVNNEAQYGEFPWMIAVIRSEKVNENITLSLFQCGGSLIHPRVVMTAAHCVARTDKTKLFVRAGEWDTQTKNERFPHEEQQVSEVIIHEKFYSGGLFNDIALLITPQPFNLSHHIDTVCLPNQNHVQENVVCTATGWGKDEFGKTGKYQVILKKIDLPMVPRERCQTELRTTRLGKYFKLHESFVCAGGEAGHDTCKGDGGGPLVCPVNPKSILSTRFHQTGIVAWGISCGDERIPGVYANVALFRYWIDNWMRQLQFDTKYYTL